ncbi:MAG: hypothetical protein J3R72DRAFT_460273 [Linnemannia gamsii]|nr:MAG: hypothetical protein J3R72DRAFT_460273 [Linnemannia gamsii]
MRQLGVFSSTLNTNREWANTTTTVNLSAHPFLLLTSLARVPHILFCIGGREHSPACTYDHNADPVSCYMPVITYVTTWEPKHPSHASLCWRHGICSFISLSSQQDSLYKAQGKEGLKQIRWFLAHSKRYIPSFGKPFHLTSYEHYHFAFAISSTANDVVLYVCIFWYDRHTTFLSYVFQLSTIILCAGSLTLGSEST